MLKRELDRSCSDGGLGPSHDKQSHWHSWPLALFPQQQELQPWHEFTIQPLFSANVWHKTVLVHLNIPSMGYCTDWTFSLVGNCGIFEELNFKIKQFSRDFSQQGLSVAQLALAVLPHEFGDAWKSFLSSHLSRGFWCTGVCNGCTPQDAQPCFCWCSPWPRADTSSSQILCLLLSVEIFWGFVAGLTPNLLWLPRTLGPSPALAEGSWNCTDKNQQGQIKDKSCSCGLIHL